MEKQLIEKTYSEVKEALDSVYKKRKSTQLFQKIMWMITGLYFVIMLLIMASNYFPDLEISQLAFLKFFESTPSNPYASIYPLMGLIVLLYLSTSIFANLFRKFKLKESETIAKMVKLLFPKVNFTQNTMAPANEIVSSKLFAWIKKDSPIYSYGQIRSKIDDTEINISDIGIVEENISNKFTGVLMRIPILNMFVVLYQYVFKNMVSNKSADNIYYTYRGMFCWLKFKKKLNGHTVVLPSNQKNKLDRFASFNFKEEQKINLEDPRFTNQFVVYSTDQVEARYVLSTTLMERIVLLKEKFNQPIYLSFHNQQMFLAVKNENGLFSFSSGKLDTIKVVEELAHDIKTALKIASELKLRQQIGNI